MNFLSHKFHASLHWYDDRSLERHTKPLCFLSLYSFTETGFSQMSVVGCKNVWSELLNSCFSIMVAVKNINLLEKTPLPRCKPQHYPAIKVKRVPFESNIDPEFFQRLWSTSSSIQDARTHYQQRGTMCGCGHDQLPRPNQRLQRQRKYVSLYLKALQISFKWLTLDIVATELDQHFVFSHSLA